MVDTSADAMTHLDGPLKALPLLIAFAKLVQNVCQVPVPPEAVAPDSVIAVEVLATVSALPAVPAFAPLDTN